MASPLRNALRLTVIAALAAAAGARPSPACTTAVASGRATANGRPLLWKNRDADNKQNQVIYDSSGRIPFLGVVNSADAAGLEIWAGVNARGFAIENSASYNLEKGESVAEGQLMRLALQSCATVAEFQALLERTNGGRDTTANFGVIDAAGGAAVFETGRKTFKRFDADDPAATPAGVVVRSNFSDSGDADAGSGFLRRQRAAALIGGLVGGKALTAATLLAGPGRDVANERIGSFPAKGIPAGAVWAYTADSVCRFDTASAVVFEGVRPGEDPLLATLWVIVGQPITGAGVPLWAFSAHVPAALAPSLKTSEMTKALDAVRTLFYPETRGELKKFVRVEALAASDSGIEPRLLKTEAENFRQAEAALAAWRNDAPTPQEVSCLQDRIAERTLAAIRALAPQPAPR